MELSETMPELSHKRKPVSMWLFSMLLFLGGVLLILLYTVEKQPWQIVSAIILGLVTFVIQLRLFYQQRRALNRINGYF